MPTSADRPESTSTPTSSAQTQSSVHARPSLTAHAGAWAIAVVAFLAGGGGLLAIVPETARFAVAGTALTLTGLGLGLLGVARARAEHQIAALGARVAELSAETETLRDNAWHLKESDTRHRDVLDTLGDIVVRWRKGGEIVYANDAAQGLFPDRCMPMPTDMTQASVAEHQMDMRQTDTQIQTPDGPRWFSRCDIPVRDPQTGAPLIQTILRDVTARREVEDALVTARNQAETANASKSRFLATVSHEIRTPLNGILGMAGLLRDTRLTSEQASYLDAIRGSGEILLMLINEVLDMSKIEAGRLDLSPGPVDLAALAEGVTELLAPRAQAKDLEIACYVAPGMPSRVVLDGVRLRQILFNLAGNGLKFTETGGVSIEIAPAAGETPGETPHCFCVTVTDTGIGFDTAAAERLFGEFEQFDHGPARQFDGAGLGLAISRRLARMMGGDVTAHAKPGQGATFRVRLPLIPMPPSSAHADEPQLRPEDEQMLSGRTVAFVTQSRIEAPLVARRLSAAGAHVQLIAPGDAHGDDVLLATDLILLDPGALSDAGAWLAGLRAAGAHAPAVVTIAPSERDRLPRLKAAGFAAYLIRPIRAASLHQVVNAIVGGTNTALAWDPRAARHDHAGLDTLPRTRPLHVLVADDNDINRLLSEALLRKLGHECTLVADGAQALDAIGSACTFDMILMDLHMPGMDGPTAIHRFREIEVENDWPRIPVYAVTADVTPEACDAALAAGADAVLAKPLDPELLAATLAADARHRLASSLG